MWYVVRAAKEKTMIQKLIEKIQKTKAPICVGLDPMLNYIPEYILKKSFREFGEKEQQMLSGILIRRSWIIPGT